MPLFDGRITREAAIFSYANVLRKYSQTDSEVYSVLVFLAPRKENARNAFVYATACEATLRFSLIFTTYSPSTVRLYWNGIAGRTIIVGMTSP